MLATKLITRLTPGQEQRLGEVYQEWLQVGRSCGPVNRTEATAILGEFYSRIGKPAPTVLFFSSPMMCILAWGVLSQLESQLRSQLGSQLGSQLRSQLESQLESQLRSQLESQLRSQLESQLGSQLESQLGSQLESQLGSQLRSQLESQLGSQLRSQLRSQLWSQLGNGGWPYFAGQHWCAWEVFYAFCGEIGVRYGADEKALLDLWLRQSRELHWWFPYEGIVLASERHTALELDDRGRLHSPDKMACGYSDGCGVYAWHGTLIPERYYEKPVTAVDILGEQNAEVRRCLMERYGIDRFVLDAGAKSIHRERDNELLAIDLRNDPDGRLVALKLRCPSTAAVYIIRVPPDQRKVREALAWSFNVSEYVLEAES
jgi:hypothetical protein